MSGAFDSVPYLHLISGVSSVVFIDPLSWLSFYLKQRSQVVSIDGITSNPRTVTSGAIQGRVHGPSLSYVHIIDALN